MLAGATPGPYAPAPADWRRPGAVLEYVPVLWPDIATDMSSGSAVAELTSIAGHEGNRATTESLRLPLQPGDGDASEKRLIGKAKFRYVLVASRPEELERAKYIWLWPFFDPPDAAKALGPLRQQLLEGRRRGRFLIPAGSIDVDRGGKMVNKNFLEEYLDLTRAVSLHRQDLDHFKVVAQLSPLLLAKAWRALGHYFD